MHHPPHAQFDLHSLYAPFLRTRPDAPMLLQEDAHGQLQAISYRAFDDAVRRTAAWLAAQGIGAGDRFAVWLPNRAQWLHLLFAADQLGATVVACNTRYRSSELQYILQRSAARLLVMQRQHQGVDFARILAQVERAQAGALQCVALLDEAESGAALLPDILPGVPTRALRLPQEMPGQMPQKTPALARDLILFTTSGTTSGPKLVRHCARTLVRHVHAVARASGLNAPDARLLAIVPLCGVFGLDSVLAAIAGGAPVLLMDGFDGARAAQWLRQQRITHCFGSDDMFGRIARESAAAGGGADFPHARLFGFAGFAPDTHTLAQQLAARGWPLAGLYGSSEVQALFAVQPESLPPELRLQGGGLPAMAQAQVRVRDPESGQLCAPGINGELEIRSPGNFTGYLDNPQATLAAFTEDGFFKTGDLGHLRADGTFVYQARMGDTLRLGGFLVDPAEIEAALLGESGVDGAQVVGVSWEGRQRVVAFVVSRAALDADALLAALRGKLAAFKIPLRIWQIGAFPGTPGANGFKVQRTVLRQMAQERLQQGTD